MLYNSDLDFPKFACECQKFRQIIQLLPSVEMVNVTNITKHVVPLLIDDTHYTRLVKRSPNLQQC